MSSSKNGALPPAPAAFFLPLPPPPPSLPPAPLSLSLSTPLLLSSSSVDASASATWPVSWSRDDFSTTVSSKGSGNGFLELLGGADRRAGGSGGGDDCFFSIDCRKTFQPVVTKPKLCKKNETGGKPKKLTCTTGKWVSYPGEHVFRAPKNTILKGCLSARAPPQRRRTVPHQQQLGLFKAVPDGKVTQPWLKFSLQGGGWLSFKLALSAIVASAIPEWKHGARRASRRRNRAMLLHNPGHLAHAAGFEHPVSQVRVGQNDVADLCCSEGGRGVHHLGRRGERRGFGA